MMHPIPLHPGRSRRARLRRRLYDAALGAAVTSIVATGIGIMQQAAMSAERAWWVSYNAGINEQINSGALHR